MPAPSVIGQANNAGQAAFSLTLPAHQLNDLILVGVETANEAVPSTAFTANGYTEVTVGAGGPALGQGTAAGANATKLTIWWRRAANSTMPAVYVADSGDHQAGFAAIIRDANTTYDPPWELAANTRQTTNTTTVSFNSFTTTNANTLIVHVAGVDTDTTTPQGSSPTNANLADLTEHVDIFTNAQDGGGIILLSGRKITTGSTGNTTLTLATTEIFSTWSAVIVGEPDPTAKPWAQAIFI
jgi:hypothetical protein